MAVALNAINMEGLRSTFVCWRLHGIIGWGAHGGAMLLPTRIVPLARKGLALDGFDIMHAAQVIL